MGRVRKQPSGEVLQADTQRSSRNGRRGRKLGPPFCRGCASSEVHRTRGITMQALKVVLARLTGLFRGSAIDRDMDKEMSLHVEMLTEEYKRSGMPADEARRAALRRFGNPTQLKERGHDIRGAGLLEEFRRDLQYGYRML